jgi:hypothetical protein
MLGTKPSGAAILGLSSGGVGERGAHRSDDRLRPTWAREPPVWLVTCPARLQGPPVCVVRLARAGHIIPGWGKATGEAAGSEVREVLCARWAVFVPVVSSTGVARLRRGVVRVPSAAGGLRLVCLVRVGVGAGYELRGGKGEVERVLVAGKLVCKGEVAIIKQPPVHVLQAEQGGVSTARPPGGCCCCRLLGSLTLLCPWMRRLICHHQTWWQIN